MRRLALYPFALIYGTIIWLRNLCFDIGLFRSRAIEGKSICVGNITVGGTGKSPHVSYLIEQLKERFDIQVLSRGYGRNTKGFILVDRNASAQQVGDEPLMLFKLHHTNAQFAVCENRQYGVQRLRSLNSNSLIILDDAFQHRWVSAGLNLVLTTWGRPIRQDALLPSGNLREPISGLKRAHALIVTKCPAFDSVDYQSFIKDYEKWNIPIFFSRYAYRPLSPLTKNLKDVKEVLIVSAIAHPQFLKGAFDQEVKTQEISYPDHHTYKASDVSKIHQFFDTFATENTAIVTTAKDWVKIQDLLSPEDQLKYPWYLLTFELEWQNPIAFNQFINRYVSSN